jgi:hypothetical protein
LMHDRIHSSPHGKAIIFEKSSNRLQEGQIASRGF